MRVKTMGTVAACLAATLIGGFTLRADDEPKGKSDGRAWTDTFEEKASDLVPTGRNPFFILEPGYTLEFAGKDKGKQATLVITVLDETRKVDGVETRVVEERETLGGAVVEVSRNYFAISKVTNNVYYFGEEVDIYKKGKVVSHEGGWLSGNDGARYGLAMPGTPLLGSRYYQEVAPGKAMDRAEVTSLTVEHKTPAGTFKNCLVTEETTPLEPGDVESKVYARGVGLLQDGVMKLVRHGVIKK